MALTPEQAQIRDLARALAQAELRPRSAEWDVRRALDDAVFAKLAELGFLGMLIPEEHGGLGLDVGTYLLALEELAWGDAAVALSVSVHNGLVAGTILRHGTPDQRSRWLARLASGELLGAFALSEPDAGSDPASLTASATHDGTGWRIEGTKRWVTNGARAGVVIVFARVAERGVAAFLVTPDAEGYRLGAAERTLGLRASQTVSVELEGVRVGPDALLGEVGRGLTYALEALDTGRVGIAILAVGIARAALEHATAYALQREQFGGPLADLGAIQAKLADMHRKVLAARLLAHEAAASLQARGGGDAQGRSGPEGATARAAAAKLTASETATWVSDEAVQIFGGYGFMRDFPVEKLLRDAKGTEIFEGTSEMMRHVIARELLRPARGG